MVQLLMEHALAARERDRDAAAARIKELESQQRTESELEKHTSPDALAPDEQQVCEAVHAKIAALREKLATADARRERIEREQVDALADEIMALADRFVRNQLLSVTELDTFVRGSKHAHFGEWLRKTAAAGRRRLNARRRQP